MGRYWKPEGNIVRIIPVGDRWDRRPRGGGSAPWLVTLLMLIGAVVVGLVGALVWQQWDDRVAPGDTSQIEWNEVQAVPKRAPDADDREWEMRSSEEDSPSTSSGRTSGVRANFGFCHTGGGTNCVVDGDTFWIGGRKVRIAGIDAPETHPPRCAAEARLGTEATAMLRSLLNSGAVTMTGIDRDRDGYGRLLRNVAVDGQDVGEAMISAGRAREYGSGRRSWC
jgi:hypothetical protein